VTPGRKVLERRVCCQTVVWFGHGDCVTTDAGLGVGEGQKGGGEHEALTN